MNEAVEAVQDNAPAAQVEPELVSSNVLGSKPDVAEEGEYFLSEGIKGTGDIPEWFNAKKYKSVAEQAKAQRELEKKLGSRTGAPEAYELPESVDPEDALYHSVMELSKEMDIDQEGFNKISDLITNQLRVSEEVSVEQELQKLGSNAQERINTVKGFLFNNLGQEGYNEVESLVKDADSVMLVEKLIKATQPKKLPIDGGDNPKGLTMDMINKKAFAKDENGNLRRSVDPEYNRMIEQLYREYAGD